MIYHCMNDACRFWGEGETMDRGEIESGLICIASPVFGINRKIVAAVSASGPDYRMEADREMVIQAVKKAARNISYLLGYRGE